MAQVLIRHLPYDQDKIQQYVNEMLDSQGPDWVTSGMRVLVKPNLLLPAPPHQAIVTHPLICKAVAIYMLGKGARVQISDSPGMGSFQKIIEKTGYKVALRGLDVDLKPLKDNTEVDIGVPFGKIPIASDVIEADRVINLAKLKSHGQMYLTLSIKNMFGCIVGRRKAEWHMRAGMDRMFFAQLLVQIYETIHPSFTIVDGILALEGLGPGASGRPRQLGMLIGGENGHAVDKTICTLLGLDPMQLLTYRQAFEKGLCPDEIYVNGDLRLVEDFIFPKLHSLSLGPEALRSFMRKYIIQRPVINPKACKTCGECWNICPANAITHDVRGVKINTDPCIRCYCCIEVCPHAAIDAREPLLGKLRSRIFS